MSCRFSQEGLALYAGGDLSDAAEECAARHLNACDQCREFVDQLRHRQALLQSLRQEIVTPADCSRMRHDVMSIISAGQQPGGWALRVERVLWLGVRRRPYALATAALLCVVSASVVAQMRQAAVGPVRSEALFLDRDTLARPAGYRDWIVVGTGAATADHCDPGRPRPATRTVYINPSAYRVYASTGEFPDGTLMVWEAKGDLDRPSPTEPPAPALLVSVKDSGRFEDGWGFFDFTPPDGGLVSKAATVSDANTCRNCHRRDAATDHVFTQFYPELQSARRGMPVLPRPKPVATDPLA